MTSVSDRVRLPLALLLAGALLVAPGIARAEPRPEEREMARTLLISGREKRKAGDLNGALGDFYRAHGIMHVPTTGLDLGKAQGDLGMLVEARNTFLETAKIPVKPNESAAFGRAREEAKRLAEEVAKKLGTVTVTVKGVPAAAKVIISVDGADNSAAQRGVPFKVNPGKREIGASHGENRGSKKIEIAPGGSQAVELTLGTSTDVELDPQAPANEPAGKVPGSTTAPALEDPPPADHTSAQNATTTRTNPLVFVGAGAAVLGAGVGTVTGLMSMSIYSSVAPQCPRGLCPPSTHADIDKGIALSAVATGAFIFAGVGALVGVYGLLKPIKETPKKTSVVVVPTPVGVAGTF